MTMWLTVGLSLMLGTVLVLNKKYSRLYLLLAYVVGTAAISVAYNIFFHNWYFYLYANNVTASLLFALAYWEIARKLESKNLYFLLLAAAVVPLTLFLQVGFVTKTILPFFIVDIVVAMALPFALSKRNPFLIVWSLAASWAVTFDIVKMFVSRGEVLTIMEKIDFWTSPTAKFLIIGAVVWQPVGRWIYQQLEKTLEVRRPALSLVRNSEGGGDSAKMQNAEASALTEIQGLLGHSGDEFVAPEFDDIQDDMDALNPVLKTAAKMLTLNHKPFLTQDEAMFYLDMSEGELEEFLHRYEIRRIYLTGEDNKWVVRRDALESIDD